MTADPVRQTAPHLGLGKTGEGLAEQELKRRGYVILAKNFRRKVGEVDLVAREGDELVFVEVKTRRAGEIGHPAEFVDERKQRKLARTAAAYLQEAGLDDAPCRFDVVCVIPSPGGKPIVEVIQSAFMIE